MVLKYNNFFIFVYLITVFFVPCSANASSDEQIIVDLQWLNKIKQTNHWVIVDVRTRSEYDKGHIPDAVNIPVSSTFNPKIKKDRVANTSHIQKLFSQAGIESDDTIVLYDSGNHIDAGRVFWVFELYGHKKVKVLNGGFVAWTDDKENPVSTISPIRTSTQYIPKLEPERLTTKLSMQLAISDEERIIIDARSSDEYLGNQSIASRSGHIPGAINIPWDKNFTSEEGFSKLKSVEELRKLYGHIDPEKKIYLYCNKGKQSSMSYMIMRQLGFDAAHYDGSWYEWGNDELLPIETE